MEKDLQKRMFGVGIGLLGIFSYFLQIIPDGLKNIFVFTGLVLATFYVITPQLMVLPNTLVEKFYCPSCKITHTTEIQNLTKTHSTEIQNLTEIHKKQIQELNENNPGKNIRFKNYEKFVTIDEQGKGWLCQVFELYNAGENYLQRFPIELATSTSCMDKTLIDLERDNEFKIESKDGHVIRWEPIQDDKTTKKINAVFDQKIGPKETRKYTVRYYVDGLYHCKSTSARTYECSSFIPIHMYENIKIKVTFLPKYKHSNPRYCVYSPGGDLIDKCRPLKTFDDASGGTYIEVKERYPSMHYLYQVEWDLP